MPAASSRKMAHFDADFRVIRRAAALPSNVMESRRLIVVSLGSIQVQLSYQHARRLEVVLAWNRRTGPLWVKSRHESPLKSCPLYPRKWACSVQLATCPLWANSGHRNNYGRSGSNAATRGKST